MRLLVRHGINGKEELAIQVANSFPVGWDIMKQLACRLDLESPFQIVLYLNSTAAILSLSAGHRSSCYFDRLGNLLSCPSPAGSNSRALSIPSDSTL